MKKTLTVLMVVMLSVMFIVSCDNKVAEPTKYTVTFDSNGGTSTPTQSVEEGKKATMPTIIPSHTGWRLLGWTTVKDDATTKFDFNNETITADITLYALWNKSYSVGGTGPAGGTVFYDAGSEQTTTYKDSDGNDVSYTWRYLEAAPATDAKDGIIFGYYRNENNELAMVISDTTENVKIGAGHSNTRALVNAMKNAAGKSNRDTTTTDTYAAKYCDDYVNAQDTMGHDDWFLPSKDEFQKLIDSNVRDLTAVESEMYWKYYWVSSEESSTHAFYYNANTKEVSNSSRSDDSNMALPVRAF